MCICACVHVCVSVCVFYTGPVCTCECVWEAVFNVGSWKYSSCCRGREGERIKEGETPAQEREAKRGTSTGSLCTGSELLQSESPYRKKAGSSQQYKRPRTQTHVCMHTSWRVHTHTHYGAEQHRGQRECTAVLHWKRVLFRLTAMCKE